MSPTLAIVFIAAAALIFVPLAVASDLWTRARNRGRLPSLPAMVTILLALASCLHNLLFVYRGAMAGGDGLSGLNVVLALWSTMGILVLWGTLINCRVRLYRPMDASIVPATARVHPPRPATTTGLPEAAATAAPHGFSPRLPAPAERQDPAPIVRLVYRDDPAPGVPCAPPLSMMRMQPTLRDIVRAAPALPSVMPAEWSPPPAMPQDDATRSPLPRDVLAVRAPAARFASRPMAAALRNSDRAPDPVSDMAEMIPQFRTTRVWAPAAAC